MLISMLLVAEAFTFAQVSPCGSRMNPCYAQSAPTPDVSANEPLVGRERK